MKILLVSVNEAMPESVQQIYQNVFGKVCGSSNNLVIRSVTKATARMTDVVYSYGRLHNSRSFCERAMEAQNEGFDAIVTT